MKHFLLLLSLPLLARAYGQKTGAEQWRADIRFFMEQAPKTHVNLYHSLPKHRFDSLGAALLERVPALSDEQITTELIRWMAALGDGHSNLTPLHFHLYPVLTFWFDEGFFVIEARGAARQYSGWKLEKINGRAAEEIAAQLRPWQERDGEQQIRAQAPRFLVTEELLRAIGVLQTGGKALFTFHNTQTGARQSAELESMEPGRFFHDREARRTDAGSDAETPLYRRNRYKNYWFEWLPEARALYFQYNVTQEDEAEPIPDFIQKLAHTLERNPAERFIVDLRWNGGGNLQTAKPFLDFIAQHPAINQRGKLFVLLGRNTFSAASYVVSALEFRTHAIFVGEPTGAAPNHYGDPRPLRLPHSGLRPMLSTIYWQNSFPWDERPNTAPDILVNLTAADWLANRDAALDAALAYRAEPLRELPLPDSLKAKLLGSYRFDTDRLLTLQEEQGRLRLTCPDWFATDLFRTRPGETLHADLRSLTVAPAGPERIRVEAFGGSAVLEKLPAGFLFPKDLLQADRVAEGIAAYRSLKKEKPDARSVQEAELNRIGYQLLNAKRREAALAVFQLNTEFYPRAFNTWDSLAECYMLDGDKENAIRFYKKSIELNPGNENGKRMLKKLE